MMKIYHLGGMVECKTIEELSPILDIRYDTGVNEFLMIDEKKDYPYLAIMVNNEYAVLIFFPKEEGEMFQAIGENTGLNPAETSVFYFGTPNQETQVWNEFVVPFAKAKEAAIEFFTSLSLPACVEWSKQ
jgi:hypothetical protein